MEGAGAPDVGAAAMDFGVIQSRDMVAVPEPARSGLNQAGQAASNAVGVPGAVFGEGFHGLPVEGSLQGQDGLGDRVLFDIDGHGRNPLGEAAVTGPRESPGEALKQGLPEGPKERSVRHGVSPEYGAKWVVTTWQVPSRSRRFQ